MIVYITDREIVARKGLYGRPFATDKVSEHLGAPCRLDDVYRVEYLPWRRETAIAVTGTYQVGDGPYWRRFE